MWRLGGQGVARCNWGAAFSPVLHNPWAVLPHVHTLEAGQPPLGRLKRLEAEPGTGHPLHAAMILCQDSMPLLHLADDARRAVRFVVSPEGGRLGLAPIAGERLRHAVATNRLGEEARGGALVPLLREEASAGLPGLLPRPLAVRPLAVDLEGRVLPPPAAPERPLAAVERRFERGSVLHDPPLAGRVSARPPRSCIISSRWRSLNGSATDHRTHVRSMSFPTWAPWKLPRRALPLVAHPTAERQIIPPMAGP
jgi:hypothetical protein